MGCASSTEVDVGSRRHEQYCFTKVRVDSHGLPKKSNASSTTTTTASPHPVVSRSNQTVLRGPVPTPTVGGKSGAEGTTTSLNAAAAAATPESDTLTPSGSSGELLHTSGPVTSWPPWYALSNDDGFLRHSRPTGANRR